MSVLSGLFFKEMYELLVGECQTVRNNGVSVERGSTVLHLPGISRFSRCYVIAPLIPTFLIDGPRNRAQVTYGANLARPIVPIV